MEKELRYIDNSEVRFVGEGESREVEGYAILFNTLSRPMRTKEGRRFAEQISPEALNGVIENSDIMATLNHDKSRGILGRSRFGKGSLTLSIDERGLKYSFSAPNTALGDECLEYLRRGDINQSSFAFTTDKDSWEPQADGSFIRTISHFDKLYDVSPVFEPAYFGTEVSCRSLEDFIEEEERKEAEAKAEAERLEHEKRDAEEAEKEAKLAEYYRQMRKEYEDALKKGEKMNKEQTNE